jgi:uncharacterized membrane-anchored protein
MFSSTFPAAVLAVAASLFGFSAHAAEGSAPNELDVAYEAAGKALQKGRITLREQASLTLPDGYGYVPEKESRALLTAMGNSVGDENMGMVFPMDGGNWFIALSYHDAGYIKDDDAREWNPDDLLDSLKAGTEEANKERAQRGIAEMEIVGWVEKPHYDSASNRLVWSLEARDKGQPDSPENNINYNTYALGREGYISMNLITDKQSVNALKPTAKELLGQLHFNDGKRYADFDASKDRVAEYGLAALVGGVAAKKLGFFAVIGVFLAKFAKVAVIGGIALLAGLKKFFGRKDA